MKLIATRIPGPLDSQAQTIYDSEFKNKESGFILFPEGSLDTESISAVHEIASKYNIGIIGTSYEFLPNHQKSIIISPTTLNIGSVSYSGQFIPDITSYENLFNQLQTDDFIKQYYAEDKQLKFKIGDKDYNSLVRICSDIALPYLKKDISNLFLIPSAIEHPKDWFAKNMTKFSKNLTPESKIVYSPLKTDINYSAQQMGIYDLKLNQLGDVKEDYVVLNIN